jgi:hypothetical protein
MYLNTDPEQLLDTSDDMAHKLRHPKSIKPYYWEFYQIKDSLKGLFDKSFCYDDFFIEGTQDLSEKQLRYFSTLIANSDGRPVLQFCRSAGRISALKRAVGGTHIHLWRNPRDQWWSFKVNNYFDIMIQQIYNAREIPPVLLAVKRHCGISEYHNEAIEKEFAHAEQHPLSSKLNYFAFYALWLYAFIGGEEHSDISISIDRLTVDKGYMLDTIRHLSRFEINDIDLSDCAMPLFYFSNNEVQFYEEIEDRIVKLFLSFGYDQALLDEVIRKQKELCSLVDKTNTDLIDSNLLRARETALCYFDQGVDDQIRMRQLDEHIQMSETHIREVNERLQVIYNSYSWKLTAPMRWLRRQF